MVLKYNDLLQTLIYPSTRSWFKEKFADKPLSVAVVVCPYPGPGAAQWIVDTDEIAKEVSKKLGTKSRVWTLETFNEYLACFGTKPAETVSVAAMLLDRPEYDKEMT